MKKFSRIIISFLMLLTLACVIKVQGNATTPSKYFDATYYTQNIPNGYYNDVDTSLTGESFRRMLSPIISKGYVKHSYSANNEVLTYTDPDPSGNGKIICLYTGQSLSSGSWNKEHVWAKSHGFPESGYSSSEPYSDAHHLRPTLEKTNSTRGNLDFGEVSSGSSDSYGNRWNGSAFEPRDEVKGDVARMMFYMATRYGFDGTFNLTLVDNSTTSGSSGNGRFGNLQTLLKWHYQDPVSKEEIYRNNIIYTYYQKNRNPYIDHPEYVDLAYPNNIVSSTTVDEAKVNNVIELIGSLPSNVTLDHKAQINAAETAYNALNSLEKQRIVNYAELTRCLNALKELEASSATPTTPDVPTTQGDIEIDFTSVSGVGSSYTTNATITASGKTFKASDAGTWNNALRVGTKNPETLDSKFGLSEKGCFLEPQFDVENLKSMKIDVQETFSNIKSWYVFFKDSNGTYRKVSESEGAISSKKNFEITATLDAPATGRFVLVITGTQPRMDISSMSLYTEAGGSVIDADAFLTSFVTEQTRESLRLDYNETTGDINEIGLRFGGRIKASSYNSTAKYGIIIDDGEYEIFYKAGEQTSSSPSDYVEDDHYIEIKPVRVNQYGEADPNGAYYQFSWVITNMEGHYSDSLVAVIYVEYDGKLYFGNAVTASLSSVAKEYIDNDIFADPILNQVLESLYQ